MTGGQDLKTARFLFLQIVLCFAQYFFLLTSRVWLFNNAIMMMMTTVAAAASTDDDDAATACQQCDFFLRLSRCKLAR